MIVKETCKLPKYPRRILLIQLGDIGDVVLTMPTIRGLRERFPESTLAVAVRGKAGQLIEDCPWADGVISVDTPKLSFGHAISYQKRFISDLRKWGFDLAIELRTGHRGAILAFLSGAPCRIGRFADDGRLWRNRLFTHLVRPQPHEELARYAAEHHFNILSPLGAFPGNKIPQLYVPGERIKKAEQIFREENMPPNCPVIAFHPFSLWKYKELEIQQCVLLIDYIQNTWGVGVMITGSPDERARASQVVDRCRKPVVNLAGKTSIGELPAVLRGCRLFVGVDTAALHIAAAVGVPTVGIFGPSSPVSWAPRGEQHCIVSKNMPCVPCRQKGCQNSEKSRCLEALTLEEIAAAVDAQLRR